MQHLTELLTDCYACRAKILFPAGKETQYCEFCSSFNPRPKSEKKATDLMKRANENRDYARFDLAAAQYEKVLEQNIHEAEARWGLLLCKYGVIYLEDRKKRERVITCRRQCGDPILSDPEFKAACADAPDEVRAQFRRDAEYIDNIQSEIARLAAKGVRYDIFMCYKETDPVTGERTRDSVRAEMLYKKLKGKNYNVFFAPESLKENLGADYEAAIFNAIETSKVMLVMGMKAEYFETTWMQGEWRRFFEVRKQDMDRLLIPLYGDFSPKHLPDELRKLEAQEWLTLDTGDLIDRIKDVIPLQEESAKPAEMSEEEFEQVAQMLASIGLASDTLMQKAAEVIPDTLRSLKLVFRVQEIQKAEKRRREEAAEAQKEKDEETARLKAELERLRKEAEEAKARKEAEEKKKAEESPEALFKRAEELFDKNADEAKNAEAIRLYKLAAERGSHAAQYQLYQIYWSGEGVDLDWEEGAKWRLMMAKNGDVSSQECIGELYYFGWGVKKNQIEARKWLLKADAQGNKNACFYLGQSYKEAPADLAEAAKWHRKGAEAGNIACQRCLAEMYERGEGVAKNLDEAEKWYRMAAEQGDKDAQAALERILAESPEALFKRAEELFDEFADEEENAEAIRLYKLAAEKGHLEAQMQLHHMYFVGEGADENSVEAVKWVRMAAKQGHPEAEYWLGNAYDDGVGVKENRSEAIRWYLQAAEHGWKDAFVSLGLCYYYDREDYAEARKWYLRATREDNNRVAMYTLGEMYEKGKGVSADLGEAGKWYRMAAEQGDEKARAALERVLKAKKAAKSGANGQAGAMTSLCYACGADIVLPAGVNRVQCPVCGRTNERPKTAPDVTLGMASHFERQREEKELEDARAEFALWKKKTSKDVPQEQWKLALPHLEKAADAGLDEAVSMLANILRYEGMAKINGLDPDLARAQKMFRQLAEKGNAGAMVDVGLGYLYGQGVEKDDAEAVRWFRRAADQDDARGWYYLSNAYKKGWGVEEDYEKYVQLIEKAIAQNYARAIHERGDDFYLGMGVPKSYEKAAEYYRRAAELGNKVSARKLEEMEKDGMISGPAPEKKPEPAPQKTALPEKKYDAVIVCREMGADLKHTRDSELAMDLYKYLTKEGFEVFYAPKSLESVFAYGSEYEVRINQAVDSARFMFVVGTSFENLASGRVTEQYKRFLARMDRGEDCWLFPAITGSFTLPKMLADRGIQSVNLFSPGAKGEMAALIWKVKNPSGEELFDRALKLYDKNASDAQNAKAVEMMLDAADQFSTKAALWLGNYYYDRRDYDKALEWYGEAAGDAYFLDQGDTNEVSAEAAFVCGRHYELGDGFRKDSEEAIKWYEKAAAQGHIAAKSYAVMLKNPPKSSQKGLSNWIGANGKEIGPVGPDGEIRDSWAEIFKAIDSGEYKKRYAIGNTKALDLGPEGVVHMQIAAFDTDDRADGKGKAPITWISRELLKTERRMNPKLVEKKGFFRTTYVVGTGAIGGWEKCELRAALQKEVWPLVPGEVRERIREVSKQHDAYNESRNEFRQTTHDRLWIPSDEEVFDGGYGKLFADDSHRVKNKVGSSSASWWWLRSAYDHASFSDVPPDGGIYTVNERNPYWLALGFCT